MALFLTIAIVNLYIHYRICGNLSKHPCQGSTSKLRFIIQNDLKAITLPYPPGPAIDSSKCAWEVFKLEHDSTEEEVNDPE